MTISEKSAYLKGLMDGLKLSTETDEGKMIAAIVALLGDLTRKVTMQNLYHDGGCSSMCMSLRAMTAYEKGLEEYMDENGNIIYG
mgnify:CR=1 FL=1